MLHHLIKNVLHVLHTISAWLNDRENVSIVNNDLDLINGYYASRERLVKEQYGEKENETN